MIADIFNQDSFRESIYDRVLPITFFTKFILFSRTGVLVH